MKVLQINCVYGKGSTGKIVYDIHSHLIKSGHDSVVCYGRGNRISTPGIYKTCGELYAKANKLLSMLTGIMYGGCFFSTNRLLSVIRREKPDVVHLHCINGNFVNIYRLLEWLKKKRIKTILTLHAEFMYTGGCGYSIDCNQWSTPEGCGRPGCPRWHAETGALFFDRTRTMWERMKKAFDDFGDALTVVSVSPWLEKRAKASPILTDKHHCIVVNGLDTDIFKPYDTRKLKKDHGITDEKIVFHATPKLDNNPQNIKGGYYVLKIAEALENQNIKFFVAGNYDPTLTVPQNVILLGQISDQRELAKYYSMADVTLLTSRKETFSMVVAESLCCGTPVVGFQAGAPEQIALPEYSLFSEYGNMNLLKANLLRSLNGAVNTEKLRHMAVEKYDKQAMINHYMDLYAVEEIVE